MTLKFARHFCLEIWPKKPKMSFFKQISYNLVLKLNLRLSRPAGMCGSKSRLFLLALVSGRDERQANVPVREWSHSVPGGMTHNVGAYCVAFMKCAMSTVAERR